MFHINAYSLSKSFDDFEQLLKCTIKNLGIIAVSKTRIRNTMFSSSNKNLKNYSIELRLTKSTVSGTLLSLYC